MKNAHCLMLVVACLFMANACAEIPMPSTESATQDGNVAASPIDANGTSGNGNTKTSGPWTQSEADAWMGGVDMALDTLWSGTQAHVSAGSLTQDINTTWACGADANQGKVAIVGTITNGNGKNPNTFSVTMNFDACQLQDDASTGTGHAQAANTYTFDANALAVSGGWKVDDRSGGLVREFNDVNITGTVTANDANNQDACPVDVASTVTDTSGRDTSLDGNWKGTVCGAAMDGNVDTVAQTTGAP